MTRGFEGKVVIVTGGTRAIGEANVRGLIAEEFAVPFGGCNVRIRVGQFENYRSLTDNLKPQFV